MAASDWLKMLTTRWQVTDPQSERASKKAVGEQESLIEDSVHKVVSESQPYHHADPTGHPLRVLRELMRWSTPSPFGRARERRKTRVVNYSRQLRVSRLTIER